MLARSVLMALYSICRWEGPMILPGWRHPGEVCAHGPDDPLAEHDEPHGYAEPTVEGYEYWCLHLISLHYSVLSQTHYIVVGDEHSKHSQIIYHR